MPARQTQNCFAAVDDATAGYATQISFSSQIFKLGRIDIVWPHLARSLLTRLLELRELQQCLLTRGS